MAIISLVKNNADRPRRPLAHSLEVRLAGSAGWVFGSALGSQRQRFAFASAIGFSSVVSRSSCLGRTYRTYDFLPSCGSDGERKTELIGGTPEAKQWSVLLSLY